MDYNKRNKKDILALRKIYTVPPTKETELKHLVVELFMKDAFEIPCDSLHLFRFIKKLFRPVDYSVFVFNRLSINRVIEDLIEADCLEYEEILISMKLCFFIKGVNVEKLNNLKFDEEYNSTVNSEKYLEKAKTLMKDSIDRRTNRDRENLLFLNRRQTKLSSSENNRIANKADNMFDDLEDDEQNFINDIFYKPSAKMLLNNDNYKLNNEEDHQFDVVIRKMKDKYGSSTLRPFCPHGTKADCSKKYYSKGMNRDVFCEKVHFRPIIRSHTDVNLGDCSYLDTCRHMEICKFVHYVIEDEDMVPSNRKELVLSSYSGSLPSQWVNCDIRFFDLSVLGKFEVIMADPPWDIHMDLPYGTLSDDEMRSMKVSELQTDGVIFLWVTGRATELARECLEIWGYERKEELVWIKTNQLQRLIRTGRTGHWLNHSKEHCLIGLKGNPKLCCNLDCDVLVSEVRETSRKPDEIYELIERLSPSGRKIELFARPHNRRHGWISLGNQLPGVYLVEQEVINNFNTKYPNLKLTEEEMEKNRLKSIETKEIEDEDEDDFQEDN